MVSIKFISDSQLSIANIKEKELFGVHQTKCIYIRENEKNRKLLSANFEGKYSIGDYESDFILDINDNNGECLKLWNKKTTTGTPKHSTFVINEEGFLVLNTSGGQILSDSLLKLSQPLESSSGGTGFNSYNRGDIIVGNNGILNKLPVSNNNKQLLMVDKDSTLGVSYGLDIFSDYYYMTPPIYSSPTFYSIDKIKTRDYLNRDTIIMENTNVPINEESVIPIMYLDSDTYPEINSTTIVVGNTGLLKKGDIISLEDTRIKTSDGVQNLKEYRKVIEVSQDSVQIDTPYTLLNNWTLNGTASLSTSQSRFGGNSLSCNATTAFARVIVNPSFIIGSTWTVEMFVRLTSSTTTQSIVISNLPNSFRINYIGNSRLFRISLGQGSSYNIANNLSGPTAISANVWYHIAVVKSTTNYLFFVNGILQNTITSTLSIPTYALNNLRIGGDATTMTGFIDEFRLSSINRYTSTFTPATDVFSLDDRTVILNHFEKNTIENSDDRVDSALISNYFPLSAHGYLYKNSVFYLYSYTENNVNKLILTTRTNEVDSLDLLSLNTTNIRRLPFYITISQVDNSPHSTLLCGGYYDIHPNITLISNASNTYEIISNLNNFLPIYATRIRILITHNHIGTIECGISAGTRSELKNTYLITNVASITSLTIDIPIINLQLITNLSILASTTSYSVLLLGYHC